MKELKLIIGRGSTGDGNFEKFIGQGIPTVKQIMAMTGMSRSNAIKEYQRIKEGHRLKSIMPSPANYAKAYDSWSMD